MTTNNTADLIEYAITERLETLGKYVAHSPKPTLDGIHVHLAMAWGMLEAFAIVVGKNDPRVEEVSIKIQNAGIDNMTALNRRNAKR
jgi:hypothetical protein